MGIDDNWLWSRAVGALVQISRAGYIRIKFFHAVSIGAELDSAVGSDDTWDKGLSGCRYVSPRSLNDSY